MITDHALRSTTALGRLARLPLRLVAADREVRVLRGPARGLRWIAGSASHGCWLGTYEPDVLHEFAARIRPGDVVYDVGANVGLFSLIAAARGAHVWAFEPAPRNLSFLRRHAQMNSTPGRIAVVESAVGEGAGRVRFQTEPTGLEGAIAADGDLEVQVVSLDRFGAPPPTLVKIDVEGGEEQVLAGARSILERYRPTVLIEVHPGHEEGALAVLRGLGYRIRELGDARRVIAEMPPEETLSVEAAR